GIAGLPVLDAMARHVRMRRMERQVTDQAEAMASPCGAVVALLIGAPSGVLRGLNLLEQIGMISFFAPQDVVETMRVQGLDVGSMRTQTLFSDDALEVGMILAPLGYKALGGIPCAIILIRSITVHNRLRHERHDGPLVWMDERSAEHLMRIGDGPVAVPSVYTRGTVNRLRRTILRAIQGQEVRAIQKCHRFQRLAALHLP